MNMTSTLRIAPMIALAATLVSAATVRADYVISDDLVVQGTACIGPDCVNGDPVSTETLRLKAQSTRIRFFDTSSGSFPNTNWQLTANDSQSGGANRFSIEDLTAATVPFTIRGAAPSNALYVDPTGNVGLGTATPILPLQVTRGNSPAIRLEQTAAGGFPAQTWDLLSNETNFAVRDVTAGSRLPLRVRAGAPTSSLDIAASGMVGVNTQSPAAQLHVVSSSPSTPAAVFDAAFVGIGTANPAAQLHVQNPSTVAPAAIFGTGATAAIVRLVPNTGTNTNFWNVVGDLTEFRINASAGTTTEFRLNQNGNLTISGSLFTGGSTCGGGCDRVFTADYPLPTIREHAREMWQKGHLPTVGPTPEDQPINVSDKLGRMLNELEKAHIYIDQLHRRLEALERDLAGRKG
jgi:hypothetical protein